MSAEWLWWCNMRGESQGASGTEICSVKATIVRMDPQSIPSALHFEFPVGLYTMAS